MQKQLIIIGAGPGGYTAAFYAADLGLKVTLIDSKQDPGGVCLYVGCIPSKTLLHASKMISLAKEAPKYGIDLGTPKINLKKLRDKKNEVISHLTGGLGQLCKRRKIEYIQGKATFLDEKTIEVQPISGDTQKLTFENAIVATGSLPNKIPNLPSSPSIIDSTKAIGLQEVPETMLVVGGGYIGLELGSVYANLGANVSVVEMTPGLLPGLDRDLGMVLTKQLKTMFNEIMLETKVVSMEEVKGGIKVTFEDKKGQIKTQEFNKVMVSIGRKPNNENVGLENTEIEIDERGFIKTNNQCRTSVPNIYAVGDIAGQPMLAHKASHEAKIAAKVIAGKKATFEPKAIPAAIYTDPEVAWVGLTETQAKAQNKEIMVLKFPWAASGRALTLSRPEGFTKLIADPKTEQVLGMAVVGPDASELISEGTLAIEKQATASDLMNTIHPHPTLSETIMESAECFYGCAPHIYRPRKQPKNSK